MSLSGLKSKSQQGYVPFWRLQGRIYFHVFSSSQKLPVVLGLWLPSFIFKAIKIVSLSPPSVVTLSSH